jgi:DNA-binding PadR family transcriptional regulator
MTIVKKSGSGQAYRHTPAFILLFLARENSYGSQLLKTMQKEMPCYHTDSAIIYRSLQELEKAGEVESYWETDTSGPARKWYKITENGWSKLGELKADIEMRKANFDYFLGVYDEINTKE